MNLETRNNYSLENYTTDRSLVDYEKFLGISLKEMKEKKVLDIGSGAWETFSKEAKEKGIDVFSMSPNWRDGIVYDKKEFFKDWTQKTVASIVQEIPFKDESFDCELALFSVPLYLPTNIEEFERFISEIYRTLKHGGSAYIYPLNNDEEQIIQQVLKEKYNIRQIAFDFLDVKTKKESIKSKRLVLTKK